MPLTNLERCLSVSKWHLYMSGLIGDFSGPLAQACWAKGDRRDNTLLTPRLRRAARSSFHSLRDILKVSRDQLVLTK